METRFNINFMRYWKVFISISALIILLSWILIGVRGLKYGIDFAGGTNVLLTLKGIESIEQVRDISSTISPSAEVQTFGTKGQSDYLISVKNEKEESQEKGDRISKKLISAFTEKLGVNKVVVLQVDTVGSKIGKEFKENGLISIALALFIILIYIAFRFHINFSPGAVVCLVHDVSITAGLFCLIEKEFNLAIIAALLTIVGYSLNDTIVVYDRIREIMQKFAKKKDIEELLNMGINQTLSRTILTSLTTLITTLCLYFLGSGLIKDFALALSIGVIIGTYSSIYIASPFIIIYEKIFNKKQNA